MPDSLLDRKPHYRREYHFPNGYGASVVSHDKSYGGRDGYFEVAVLRGSDLCYDTSVASDVLGWCDFREVADLLDRIAALPDWRCDVQT